MNELVLNTESPLLQGRQVLGWDMGRGEDVTTVVFGFIENGHITITSIKTFPSPFQTGVVSSRPSHPFNNNQVIDAELI